MLHGVFLVNQAVFAVFPSFVVINHPATGIESSSLMRMRCKECALFNANRMFCNYSATRSHLCTIRVRNCTWATSVALF